MANVIFTFGDGTELVLSHEELLVIFETALTALSDAYIFDMIGDALDVSDEHMKEIQEKLNVTMGRIGDRNEL